MSAGGFHALEGHITVSEGMQDRNDIQMTGPQEGEGGAGAQGIGGGKPFVSTPKSRRCGP